MENLNNRFHSTLHKEAFQQAREAYQDYISSSEGKFQGKHLEISVANMAVGVVVDISILLLHYINNQPWKPPFLNN